MSKNNNNKQTKKPNNQQQDSLAKTKLKQYLFALLIVIVITGSIVGLVFLLKNKDKEDLGRFPDLTHISLKEYNALIGKSAADDDLKDLDDNFLNEDNVFIFIYHPDFDDKELEALILKFAEDFKFNILVMNYEENEAISEQYSKLKLPDRPALIHKYLESEITDDDIYINYREIQTALATFREGQ